MRDWVAVALGIAAYDGYLLIFRQRSLTLAWWRWMADPRQRWLCLAVWGLTSSHLLLRRP